MKRILLLLSLLFAPSAFADDAVTSFGWNSVTGTFQALTRGLGWKQVPDQQTYGPYTPTLTVTSGGGTCTSNTTYQVTWIKSGHLLQATGIAGCSAVTGTIAALSMPIPNGWICTAGGASGSISDRWVTGSLCQWTATNATSPSTTISLGFANTSLAGSSVTVTGGCWVNFSCVTSN